MTEIAELKKRLAGNPGFREEYRKADAEFGLIEALVKTRTEAKLSQAEPARRIGTTQSAIAPLEGGGVSPPWPPCVAMPRRPGPNCRRTSWRRGRPDTEHRRHLSAPPITSWCLPAAGA
jgi:hypothetical protein